MDINPQTEYKIQGSAIVQLVNDLAELPHKSFPIAEAAIRRLASALKAPEVETEGLDESDTEEH